MDLNTLVTNFVAILPVSVLAAWACVLLVVDLFIPYQRRSLTALLAALGLVVALVLTLMQIGPAQPAFGGMTVTDGFAVFLNVLFLLTGLLGITIAYDYLKRMDLDRGEYYVLLLLSICGMMLMAHATDLIMVFLGLELLSIPLYVMAGFAHPRLDSEEAALKYFLLGSFSTGIVVYGTALIFGAAGTTNLAQIMELVGSGGVNQVLLLVGAALFLSGLGFKVAAVPFHMWTPDVYQGAPTPVTAFMSVGAKAGGFAALLRLFVMAAQPVQEDMVPIVWGLAALTMILGNVVAIAQTNMKRLLAYSSIAHAGYILMALVPIGQEGVTEQAVAAALFYLLAYGLTSFAAWAVVIAMEHEVARDPNAPAKDRQTAEQRGLNLEDYAGLGRKHPVLAAAMAVAMLSFTGIPPTLGFVGKFALFGAALSGGYTGLALIGVLTSLISAYYYLRVVIVMYMREGEPVVRQEIWLYVTATVSAVATVLLTLFSGPLLQWVLDAAQMF